MKAVAKSEGGEITVVVGQVGWWWHLEVEAGCPYLGVVAMPV